MVAAEDCVPKAVKYAGIILPKSLKGFLLWREKREAMVNCISNTPIWIRKITTMILMNVPRIGPTCPPMVMLRKMPKM